MPPAFDDNRLRQWALIGRTTSRNGQTEFCNALFVFSHGDYFIKVNVEWGDKLNVILTASLKKQQMRTALGPWRCKVKHNGIGPDLWLMCTMISGDNSTSVPQTWARQVGLTEWIAGERVKRRAGRVTGRWPWEGPFRVRCADGIDGVMSLDISSGGPLSDHGSSEVETSKIGRISEKKFMSNSIFIFEIFLMCILLRKKHLNAVVWGK